MVDPGRGYLSSVDCIQYPKALYCPKAVQSLRCSNIVRHKEQRVGVFVDVQNMYYSAKNMFQRKVNFSSIIKEAVAGRKLVRAFAYAIKADMKDESHFHDALQKAGFEVKIKDLQVFYGGSKKGDWDVGIAMDVIRMVDKLDCVVLVSGDGDFQELLEYVKAKGCRAEAMALGRSASSKLKEEADLFIDMESDKRKFLAASTIKKKKKKGPSKPAEEKKEEQSLPSQ